MHDLSFVKTDAPRSLYSAEVLQKAVHTAGFVFGHNNALLHPAKVQAATKNLETAFKRQPFWASPRVAPPQQV